MRTETLRLYGTFGTGEGQISGKDVIDRLDLLKGADVLEVRISSQGGSLWQGLMIYNALKDFPARKIVYIDSYAMSVASWVAMVGDEIHIAENASFMYHEGRMDPGHSTEGELLKHSATMKTLNEQIAGIYASRVGLPVEQILNEMKAETWLKAKDAIARKFATHLMPNRAIVASVDLSVFNNVPEWVRADLKPGISNYEQESAEMPEVNNATAVATETATLSSTVPDTINVTVNNAAPVSPLVPTVTNTVDVPAVENAAIIKERTRIRDVTAACNMAGCTPEVTNSFIDKGLGVADVRNELFATLCATRKPVGESGVAVENVAQTPDVKFEAEFEANKTAISNMGISKEQYVLTCKKNAGL